MPSRARCGPDVDQGQRERRSLDGRDALTCWVGWWACQDLNLGPHPYQWSWAWRPTPAHENGAAHQGPWAVHCSAEGASAASTVSVTCEFAGTAGRFQPRHIRGMRSCWSGEDDQLNGRMEVTVVVRWVPGLSV